MTSESTTDIHHLLCSWEEDRKLVLRGWCLVFISLATMLLFSVVDGRLVYVHSPLYTGFLGFWLNCRKHKCANVSQVTVCIHMSKGFIFLAMALSLVLLASMFLSFWPVCRRLNKIDYVFGFLSVGIGFTIFLSLTLFVVNCERLHPKPQVSYQLSFYLCWCASGLMLWAGTLSYLNQVRMWSYATPFVERRVSYLRWASRRQSPGWHLPQRLLSKAMSADFSVDASVRREVNYCPSLQKEEVRSSQKDDPTSVPKAAAPSDLP